MKVGDLVRVREDAGYGRSSWAELLLGRPMLVVNVETSLKGSGGDDIDIDISGAPVIEVLSDKGLWRLNSIDLEIANESR